MPNFTIQINKRGGGQVSLTLKQYSTSALDALFQKTYSRSNGVKDRTKLLRESSQLSTRTVNYSGTTCKILSVSSDPHVAMKTQALAKCMEMLAGQEGGVGVPGDEMEVCMVSAQSNPQTAYSNMSVGFVYQDPDNQPSRQRVCLILGDSVCEKGGDTLVADAVLEYYKPTFTVNHKERRAMTAIFHEFGHVYHQLRNPHHYWGIQDIQSAAIASPDKFSTMPELDTFVSTPSQDTIKDMANAMKGYGQLLSGYATKHPNEVVAETFSAVMMGVPLEDAQIETYEQMGGYMPPVEVRHKRTGQNAFKRHVLYPIAEAIRHIGE